MSAQTLLAELASLGVECSVNGDRLKLTPVARLSPELLDRLKAHKPELLAWLRRDAQPVEPTNEALEVAKPSFCDTAIEVRLSDGGWALVTPSLAGDKKYLAWVAGLFPESSDQAKAARKIP